MQDCWTHIFDLCKEITYVTEWLYNTSHDTVIPLYYSFTEYNLNCIRLN